jgi:hypothetical protein
MESVSVPKNTMDFFSLVEYETLEILLIVPGQDRRFLVVHENASRRDYLVTVTAIAFAITIRASRTFPNAKRFRPYAMMSIITTTKEFSII